MQLHRIKYLIAGILLTGLIIFSAISIYNIVAYKTPVFGPEIPNPYPEFLNTYSLPNHSTNITADDPVREKLLTEDQAWGYTWVFLRDQDNLKIFLPFEKYSTGLQQVIDDNGNKYLVWVFGVKQNSYPFFQDETHGGMIIVDAYNGHVLWFDPFL
jgi:hypothetical protein